MTTGVILIWKSLCDSDMSDTIHPHIFRSSDICDQNKHPATVTFQMSLSALNGLFVLKGSHFFLPSALLSLCNLLSVSFSLSLSMQKIGSDWKASFLIGNICEVGSCAGGVPWRRVIMGFPHPWRVTGEGERRWRGFRGSTSSLVSLPSAVWGQWHSYCWKKGVWLCQQHPRWVGLGAHGVFVIEWSMRHGFLNFTSTPHKHYP